VSDNQPSGCRRLRRRPVRHRLLRGLKLDSNIRPNRIFTADNALVLYRIGSVTQPKLAEVVDRVVSILRASTPPIWHARLHVADEADGREKLVTVGLSKSRFLSF